MDLDIYIYINCLIQMYKKFEGVSNFRTFPPSFLGLYKISREIFWKNTLENIAVEYGGSGYYYMLSCALSAWNFFYGLAPDAHVRSQPWYPSFHTRGSHSLAMHICQKFQARLLQVPGMPRIRDAKL